MRRRLVLLATAVGVALAGTVVTAAPAAADKGGCRLGAECHHGLHLGKGYGRNVGG